MRGVSPSGEHDFEVKGHFKLLGTHSTCSFTNAANGQEVAIEIKGDWIDRSAEMVWDGKTVATIARSFFNVREILGDQQTVCSPFFSPGFFPSSLSFFLSSFSLLSSVSFFASESI